MTMTKKNTPPTPMPSAYDHPDLRPAYSPKGRTTYCLVASPPEPGLSPSVTLCGKPLDFLPRATERGMVRHGLGICPQCNNLDPVDDSALEDSPDDSPPEAA